MKCFFRFTVFVLLLPSLSQAKVIKISELPWLGKLAEQNVQEFSVCGSSEIQPTKKSLAKHFILGSKPSGYLFSNLLSHQRYFKLLSEKNLDEAKAELQKEFSKTHLWKYTKEKGFEDLGTPTQVASGFSASIKDCMEGAKTTLGSDCSRFDGDSRRSCCAEKFVGPEISWETEGEYKLLYSPDPSVRFKVAGEKKHRYCNVQEAIELQIKRRNNE